MKNKRIDFSQKALNYCFLLLKFRPRSENEIYKKLKKKRFVEPVIKKVIFSLKEKGFIDDNSFAREWIESGIRKTLGLIRLKDELRQKGVADRIIEANIEKIRNNYSEEEVVSKVVKEQLNKLTDINLEKAKRRIYGYLFRRGFTSETIIDAINKLLNCA